MTTIADKYTYWYRNGLTLVFITLFLVTLLAQGLSGFKVYNQELREALQPTVSFATYLGTGHFMAATFENFESEFLQMALYVLLTVKLRQLGSAESKSLDEKEAVDREPKKHKDAPWPVIKGGWALKLYQHSLSICFVTLFLISWYFHFYGSWREHNLEQGLKGFPPLSMSDYVYNAHFWFETFQNWQSEFLSVASIVFFTIYLRQKGSPESKPVDAAHLETGK